MDIKLQYDSTFFGQALLQIAVITCTCFYEAAQRQPPKQKDSPKVVLERSCSTKFCKCHRKEPLMKTSLEKLRSVTFKEELHRKSFLMNFAKVWRALLLNNCFKKWLIKEKLNGKSHSSLPVKKFHCVVRVTIN